MPQNPLTLTRQSLYDLVWSKAMSTLAKDFGISDVALAKRCRAVDVPRDASHPASLRTGRALHGAAFGRSDESAYLVGKSSGLTPYRDDWARKAARQSPPPEAPITEKPHAEIPRTLRY